MIHLNQSAQLIKAFNKPSVKDYFLYQMNHIIEDGDMASYISNLAKKETFTLSDLDKATLSLTINVPDFGSKKDKTAFASFLASNIERIESKNVKCEITSNYIVPRKIEIIFNHLAPRIGQHEAMKSCSGITYDSENNEFRWEDAKLKGFEFKIKLQQNLHSFDSKQIQSQKERMHVELKRNITYHLNNALAEIGNDISIPINHKSFSQPTFTA